MRSRRIDLNVRHIADGPGNGLGIGGAVRPDEPVFESRNRCIAARLGGGDRAGKLIALVCEDARLLKTRVLELGRLGHVHHYAARLESGSRGARRRA